MISKIDASTLWFDAADLGSLTVEYGDNAAKPDGLDFGIALLDKHIIPARTGQLNFIVARPGGGKTTLGAVRAKRAAKKILERGTQDKETVVIITLDQAVEEVFAMLTASKDFTITDLAWGRIPHAKLVAHAMETVHLPIRMIGKSAVKRSSGLLTFDEIFNAIDNMATTQHVRPVHVMLDYIQIARTRPGSYQNKAEQVADAVLRAADLSFKYGCSIDICAQASRDVDKYGSKLPTLADCQHSSAIEQEGYRVFSLWRPILTEPELDSRGNPNKIQIGRSMYEISSNLFVMKVIKHKMTEAGFTFALRLDPSIAELTAWEI